MLSGEEGEPARKSMELLVGLGDTFDAERMIQISSAHLPSAAYFSITERLKTMEYLEEMVEAGGRFKVFTTLNPCSIDFDNWRRLGIPESIAERQIRYTGLYEKMGAQPINTCAPHQAGHIPIMGDNIAWGETLAITFANSMGARTNRCGGPTAIAAAITGRSPLFGYHLDENRRGQVLVEVNADLNDVADFGALGHFVGGIVDEEVPVFTNIRRRPTIDEVKALCAVAGIQNAGGIFHILGVTPEAITIEKAFKDREPQEHITVTKADIDETYKEVSQQATSDVVDLIVIGCPHCSLDEIKTVAGLLRGKRVHESSEFWVCTGYQIKALADRVGYTSIIERSGAMVVSDTCPLITPLKEKFKRKGYKTLVTNSATQAYSASILDLEPLYGTTRTCVESAIAGKWVGK